MQSIVLGVHNSINGGILSALKEQEYLKTNAMQIFLHSPRSWHFNDIDLETSSKFISEARKRNISFLAVHSSYLISPLSENPKTLEKSKKLFKKEIEFTERLGFNYYVIHIRENKKLSLDENINFLEKFMLDSSVNFKNILLENSSSGIGSSIKNLVYILKKLKGIFSGICIDTAHLFEAGYDIRNKDGIDLILDEIKDLEFVKMIHMNDSKTDFKSHIDRHENISQGKIGHKGFKNFFSVKYFRKLPIILETPKKSLKDDEKNIKMALNILLSD
ncbi:MAG: deoxyribonuclease IV [Elusimicrobiales bacterium]|nr:deoxyribonuclease IV [Elusimicrobiales bacterium]